MATVPGDPSNVTPMMPKWAQPTPADFLQAMAIKDQRDRMRVAGDLLSFSYGGRKITPDQVPFEQVPFNPSGARGGYAPAENVGSVAAGAMQGKVKILRPESDK